MANLQVKNVPDDLYERIRWLAKKRNTTIKSTVLQAVEREVRQAEWWEHWESLPRFEGEFDTVASIRDAREENERKLAGDLDQCVRENRA